MIVKSSFETPSVIPLHRPERQQRDDEDGADGAVEPQPGGVGRVGPEGGQQQRRGAQQRQHRHLLVQGGAAVHHQRHVQVDVEILSSVVLPTVNYIAFLDI